MKRLYEQYLNAHLNENKQMIFIEGPRQVGKTTLSKSLGEHHYISWDVVGDRRLIIEGQKAIASHIGLDVMWASQPIVVFDELHKFGDWKNFLKGFYDLYGNDCKIILTGSSKLGLYKKGGDSLMGRYFPYRIHPFSLAEASGFFPTMGADIQQPRQPKDETYDRLMDFGGFPDPFIQGSKNFWNRWIRIREQQTLKEDIRDMAHIQEIAQMEVLSSILKEQSGQLLNRSSLAKKVGVSVPTISRWLEVFASFYYTFNVKPWHKNVTRSLIKEPKLYFWDWSLIDDPGARFENFVASHLLKFVNYFTDIGMGDYDLYFLRDKEKREVDFLVVKDGQPWFLVETKLSNNQGVSKNLKYFQEQIGARHAFQLVNDMDFIKRNCFEYTSPIIVPAKTFLSQLV